MGIAGVVHDAARKFGPSHAARLRAKDTVRRAWSSVLPYRFRYGSYPGSFLDQGPPPGTREGGPLPRIRWVVWAGDNRLTPAREAALREIRALDVPVRLVTPETLDEVLVDGAPLHRAYQHLSMNHRSDYLRAYLLHHHGGGYSDIKPPGGHWGPVFDRLEADPSLYGAGAPERSSVDVAYVPGPIGDQVRRHYSRLVSTNMVVFRAGSPFTGELLREMDARLDQWLPALEKTPGNTFGDNAGYPVPWLGMIETFHQLNLKYCNRIVRDARLAWRRGADYR